MFGALTEKFQQVFDSIRGKKTLTEDNISDVVKQVRLALLDADVNYGVASQFIKRVKEKALGDAVLKSVTPDQQFVKIVHDELVELMDDPNREIVLKGHPAIVLLCGLQGSGKTTQAAKLAHYLSKKRSGAKIMLVACDLQRPAAIEQLRLLGSTIGIEVFFMEGQTNPLVVADFALKKAKAEFYDIVIVDSAGRLHIDEQSMRELQELKEKLSPGEVLFVASANIGQDAVKTAKEFDEKIGISGTILTMLDGTARAGVAISIREITQKPLKFEGIGEKISDLQVFDPKSMADRILGMGDVVNLVRRAKEQFSEAEEKNLEEKLTKDSLTYSDYLHYLLKMKKMGSLHSLVKMLPMMPNMPSMEDIAGTEKEIGRAESIILSMTRKEREGLVELVPARRRRLARGSGTSIDDVNRMIKKFREMKEFYKNMPGFKKQMLKRAGSKEKFLWH